MRESLPVTFTLLCFGLLPVGEYLLAYEPREGSFPDPSGRGFFPQDAWIFAATERTTVMREQ